MDIFEAVRTLLAVRSYQDTPVPDAIVEHILEAGRLTGSAMNKQPWHFVVVQNRDTLRELAALAQTGPYIADVPLAIVVVTTPMPIAVSDASRAIQSMLLTAWGAGVGSNWVGFSRLAVVKPLLNVPDDRDIIAVLSFGYPAKAIGQGKKQRKPLAEIASREQFGEPFV